MVKPQQKIRIVAVLMGIALAAVIIIQFLYIKSAFQLKEEQFDRTVNHAMLSVSADLENKYGLHLVTEKLEEDSATRTAILKQDPGFYKFMVSVNQSRARYGEQEYTAEDGIELQDDDSDTFSIPGTDTETIFSNTNSAGKKTLHIEVKGMHIEVKGAHGNVVRVVDFANGRNKEIVINRENGKESISEISHAVPAVPPVPSPPKTVPAPPPAPAPAPMAQAKPDTQPSRLINIVQSAADEWAMSQMDQHDIEDIIDSEKIEAAIRKEFAKHGLPKKFVFATYCVSGDSLMINKNASKDPMKDFGYHSPLLADDFIKASSLLLIDFPGRFKYLFASLAGLLALSLLFTLSIVSAFAYSMHVILQQKKLSEVTNDFINNMTHELKTPLATISMTADTLALGAVNSNPAMVNEYSGMVKNEVKKLSGHVDKILSAAIIEKNGHAKDAEAVNINDLILAEVKVFEPMAEQKYGKIEAVLPKETIEVSANKDMLHGVISNLLDNAVKYCRENPLIKISLSKVMNNLRICVEDNGIGISKPDQKMIFEKFYRASTGNRHDVKGFGLGLNFVQSAVSQMHGRVWVESELGKGSRFFVEFPLEHNTLTQV